MDVTWIELHPDSRGFEISRGNISKDFKFVITCDEPMDFVDNATTDYLPTTSLVLYNDDAVVQTEILAVFWQQIPIFFEFVVDNEYSVLLWISSLKATQLNWNQWLVECTFDIPNDNGANQGGTNQNDPNLEKHTDTYTQISFNATLNQEKRQIAYIKECNSRVEALTAEDDLATAQNNTRKLIGQTDDTIEGFEVNVRNFSFSITQYMKPTKLTYAYVRRLARLVGSINLDKFFGFPPYSVMCMGADGAGTVYASVPVKLDFEYRPNFRFEPIIPERGSTLEGNLEVGTPNLLPPIIDSYEDLDVHGTKVVITTEQFIRIYEQEFIGNGVINRDVNSITGDRVTEFYPGLGEGVHSGWSQIYYEYATKQVVGETKLVKTPTRRYIYLPDEYIPTYFIQFLL